MTWLFCSAILLSSCLLFLVQPMCAKMLLPSLGGTPAVWNTCMVFFQTGLLLGYVYAHYAPRWLGVGRHAILHIVVLILAFFTLPIRFPDEVVSDLHPVLWLLAVLTVNAGLSFVLLAGSGPLLSRWFVYKTWSTPRDPYFLYAASNVGSFLALGLYPFILEPAFSLPQQSSLWRFGFLALTALLMFCIPISAPSAWQSVPGPTLSAASLTYKDRTRWIILAMIPSSLLLSVTTHVTTNIAAIPLLWLIPMAIYLLTFTLVFASKPPIPQSVLIRWLPFVVIVLSIVMLSEASEPLWLALGLHLLGLFWLAMLCHGELSRTRPAAVHLTDFYLCLAIGGVLGGVISALIAPLVFPDLFEYPLMIVLACLFGRPDAGPFRRSDILWAAGLAGLTALLIVALQSGWFIRLQPGMVGGVVVFTVPLIICYTMQEHATRFAFALAGVLLASGLYHGIYGALQYRERSYFGIHRVTETEGFRRLVHGNTIHGQQTLVPDPRTHRHLPLTYYAQEGPIGELFQTYQNDPRLKQRLKHVGLVGLGIGSLAFYAQPEQEWTFFEIDPSVKRIAEDPALFGFLHEARGTIHIDLGDARLRLNQSPHKFGVLVVDAFGSDAIPVHLLTQQALQVYLDHLQPDGVLAFHISNRYVDLEPVLAALAREARPSLACYLRADLAISDAAKQQGVFASVWVVLAREESDLEPLVRNAAWRRAQTRPGVKAWTDDTSNLFQVFRWRSAE